MELAIVLLVLLAGVIFYIVRPGSKHVDPSTPVNPAPAAPPAPEVAELPSESALMRMKKSELLSLATSQGVNVPTSSTKAEIVSELTTQLK
jgi:hypothetical protein